MLLRLHLLHRLHRFGNVVDQPIAADAFILWLGGPPECLPHVRAASADALLKRFEAVGEIGPSAPFKGLS